jgi:hypothetical protein
MLKLEKRQRAKKLAELTFVRALISALAFIKIFTTSTCPFVAAAQMGVKPFCNFEDCESFKKHKKVKPNKLTSSTHRILCL